MTATDQRTYTTEEIESRVDRAISDSIAADASVDVLPRDEIERSLLHAELLGMAVDGCDGHGGVFWGDLADGRFWTVVLR